ncbi:peroxiredoxin [Cumulibacter manganitolerans]|uniref:peroxiredoxin n=1 Tax=Cumulibacter manganitolerans TaxID=1884992 RepID=UPI001295C0E7|nr:peroxiredoxin [Cumulibacter manganitolerans]
MTTIRLGDPAPEFATKDQHNQDVALRDFRGRRSVLLVFYPFAFSGICTSELGAVRDDLAAFQNDAVQVLPISVDHPFALKAYAQREGYEFPLLADFWPHGAIASAYGVFNEAAGFALRGTFLIDRDGIVRYAAVNGPGEARDPREWKQAIAALST